MTRITFKPEFVDPILAGTKTLTMRFKPIPGVTQGGLVSAVTRSGKRPAFLVPAREGFALVEVTRSSASSRSRA